MINVRTVLMGGEGKHLNKIGTEILPLEGVADNKQKLCKEKGKCCDSFEATGAGNQVFLTFFDNQERMRCS